MEKISAICSTTSIPNYKTILKKNTEVKKFDCCINCIDNCYYFTSLPIRTEN